MSDYEVPTPDVESIADLKIRLNQVLIQIDNQIDSVQAYCVGAGTRPDEFMDTRGNFVMVPLLTAKAQVLTALLKVEKIDEAAQEG